QSAGTGYRFAHPAAQSARLDAEASDLVGSGIGAKLRAAGIVPALTAADLAGDGQPPPGTVAADQFFRPHGGNADLAFVYLRSGVGTQPAARGSNHFLRRPLRLVGWLPAPRV